MVGQLYRSGRILPVVPVTLRSRIKHKNFSDKIEKQWENNEKVQGLKQTKCAWADENTEFKADIKVQLNTLTNSVPTAFEGVLTFEGKNQ